MRSETLKRCGIYAGLVAACSGFAILNVLGWFPAHRFGGNYGLFQDQAVVWELIRWNVWIPLGVLLVRWHTSFYARRSGGRDFLRTFDPPVTSLPSTAQLP